MAHRATHEDYLRAEACRPECDTRHPYCECGRYYETAEDWKGHGCSGCRADRAERQEIALESELTCIRDYSGGAVEALALLEESTITATGHLRLLAYRIIQSCSAGQRKRREWMRQLYPMKSRMVRHG